jgi:hypothetical protein
MKTLLDIAVGLAGLFVEDGALALAILGVVAAAGLCAVVVPTAGPVSGAILLFGCLGVLVLNVMRAGRR